MTVEERIAARLFRKLWADLSKREPADVWSKVLIPAMSKLNPQEQSRMVTALAGSQDRELGAAMRAKAQKVLMEIARRRAKSHVSVEEVI